MYTVHLIGAGLAGSEIAYQLAQAGVRVHVHEMKPKKKTPAQKLDTFAELVCSNSFRSNHPENAVGLLKEELRLAGSFILAVADQTAVPAGDALAVDRDLFSQKVQQTLENHPNIHLHEEEITHVPADWQNDTTCTIIATGPLTSDALATYLCEQTGQDSLHFYDAIAPIVAADSLNREIVFAQSRYGKGGGDDYLNCPMNETEYQQWVEALRAAEKVPLKNFENPVYFEGCLPIEVMAERGIQTLAFGPMKPVGLVDPRTGKTPHAVVQLRQENRAKTAYNLVGFQTKLTYPEQKRIFRMIPGLEQVEFLRLGAIHRNTYLNAPRVLQQGMRLNQKDPIYLAGQIVGVEGYLESTAHGFLVAQAVLAHTCGRLFNPPPKTTALGALLAHVMGVDASESKEYGPENVHWGMFPPLVGKRVQKAEKKKQMLLRARADFQTWMTEQGYITRGLAVLS